LGPSAKPAHGRPSAPGFAPLSFAFDGAFGRFFKILSFFGFADIAFGLQLA